MNESSTSTTSLSEQVRAFNERVYEQKRKARLAWNDRPLEDKLQAMDNLSALNELSLSLRFARRNRATREIAKGALPNATFREEHLLDRHDARVALRRARRLRLVVALESDFPS